MSKARSVSLQQALSTLEHCPDRTPESTDTDMQNAYAELSGFNNGGIYVTDYAGFSEWERHSEGDELVQILEGKTTLILLIDGEEQANSLAAGELLVVPRGVWHRFESPAGIKVLTVTPQPTEHSIAKPV